MHTELGSVSVRDLRAETRLWMVALLALWGGAGGAFVYSLVTDAASMGVLAVLVLGLVTPILLANRPGRAFAGARARGQGGALTLDGDVLEVERRGRVTRVPCADVISGWVEMESGEEVVLVTRGGLELRAQCRRGEGRALLHAAGVAPEQRAVKIHIQPGETGIIRYAIIFCAGLLMPFLLLCMAAVVLGLVDLFTHGGADAMISVCGGALSTLFLGACTWPLLQRLAATTVTIGTDGVVVEQLWRRQRVPRASLARVWADGGGVSLQRSDSKRHPHIYTSAGAAAAVAARIVAALQVNAEAPVEALARLDRRDRTAGEWLAELRALVKGGSGGYREIVVGREDLLAVVNDGAAPAERRLAAAAALSSRPDDDTRKALRIAADTCADERLRVALDHAAEAEIGEEELEAAVARLSIR